MRKYIICNTTEVSSFDWSKLVDIDETYSKKSLDGSKTLIRFEGNTPSFLEGKTQHTIHEIHPIIHGSDWTSKE